MRPLRHTRSVAAVAALVAFAVVAGACSTGGDEVVATTTTTAAPTTTTTTLPPSTTTTITSEPAQRVLLLGDSGMVDAEPALQAMFESTGAVVRRGSGPGFGLTRLGVNQSYSSYPTLWPRLVSEFQPDLSVVMLGQWDIGFMHDNGIEAYVEVVQDAIRVLTADGGKILWVGMPPGGTEPTRPTNPIYEAVAQTHPGTVFYGDIEGELQGPAGDYPSSFVAADGSTVHLRKGDGWHFCQDGAAAVADQVNQMAVMHGLSVPAPESWRTGSWRYASNYTDPTCAA